VSQAFSAGCEAGLRPSAAVVRLRAPMTFPQTSPLPKHCAIPRSACAWCAARPGSACTRSTGLRGELRAILRVPDDLDINTDADLLERIIPNDMRRHFREKLQASLKPESGGDYEDEHRITRFDGTTGWILLRGKTFFSEGPDGRRPARSIGLIVDISDRKRGEEANALHARMAGRDLAGIARRAARALRRH
jgi:hypothetical protein